MHDYTRPELKSSQEQDPSLQKPDGKRANPSIVTTGHTFSRLAPASGDHPEKRLYEVTARLQKANEALAAEIQERKKVADALHRESSELQVNQVELEPQNEELRQAQTEIETLQARYFNLYERAPVGYFTLNTSGLIMEVNLMASSLLGVSQDKLAGQLFTSFILPADKDIYYQYLRRLLKERTPQVCELQLLKKDGTPFWARLEATVDVAGEEAPGCLCVLSDISRLKQAQEEQQQAEALYHTLFNHAPAGILLLDETGKLLEANESAHQQLGYTREEFSALRPSGYEMVETPEEIASHIQKVVLSGGNDFETLHRTRSGAIRNVRVWAKVVQLSDRKLFYVAYMDITERVQAQQALQQAHDDLENAIARRTEELEETVRQLWTEVEERKRSDDAMRQSEENFRLSLDESPLGVRIVTIDGETLYANRALLDIYGYGSVDELKGTPVKDRYTRESYAEFKKRYAHRLRDKFVHAEYEISIIRKDGAIRRLQVFRRTALWDGKEQFQVIYHDITERRQAEETLRKREQELAAESRQLAETNTALRVILQRREEDIREMEKKIVANVEKSVLPFLGEIRKLCPTTTALNYLDIAESNLHQVISPFLTNLAARFAAFTRREIEIATLIKNDMSSKEIAKALNISTRSVEFHRNNIRRKLGLAHKANNLCAFLITLSE